MRKIGACEKCPECGHYAVSYDPYFECNKCHACGYRLEGEYDEKVV